MPSFDEPVFRDTLFHRKRKQDVYKRQAITFAVNYIMATM